jgi:flagellar biosynthesis protein FlhA
MENNDINNGRRVPLFSKNSDIIMAGAVIGMLLCMIIPLPPILLDLLLSFNITCSLIVLLAGMYILTPLELSAFPSMLLLATLFRLSLNIASTRIILLHGNEGATAAGNVIHAFGNFVVGGNYIVGAIVFVILVIINFVVITKGSGRIAEVSARFTLDAMPGKQMSIDADLNAGLISDNEARKRREEVAKEADFYGAMDGASKFVRGDAIAGIIITMVNIIAGLAIGILQNKMSFSQAAENYTLLTVGDGLVTQIPALIVSTAAGIVISRAASKSNLGSEISSQLLLQPRAIGIAAFVIFGFGLVPGLPTIPFLILAVIAGIISYIAYKSNNQIETEDDLGSEDIPENQEIEEFKTLPPIDVLSLEVGYGLISLVDKENGGDLLERIKGIRKQVAKEIGIIAPPIHIQDNMQLKPGDYRILIKGNEVAKGELMVNYHLAMNTGKNNDRIEGIPTQEPTYGLPGFWIKDDTKENAISKGYTVVDLSTVLTTHLSHIIRNYAHELIGRQEVQKMLDNILETHPKVIEELIPNNLSLGGVVKVLQNLLLEQIPIRDLLTILECLADWSPVVKDIDTLTEYVRQSLARTITQNYQDDNGEISVLTVDQNIENTMVKSVKASENGTLIAVEPKIATGIMNSLKNNLEKFSVLNRQPIILCSSYIRSYFKKFLNQFAPDINVLSYNEILNNVNIKSLGTVELQNAD